VGRPSSIEQLPLLQEIEQLAATDAPAHAEKAANKNKRIMFIVISLVGATAGCAAAIAVTGNRFCDGFAGQCGLDLDLLEYFRHKTAISQFSRCPKVRERPGQSGCTRNERRAMKQQSVGNYERRRRLEIICGFLVSGAAVIG
jgi:hypothetical protein